MPGCVSETLGRFETLVLDKEYLLLKEQCASALLNLVVSSSGSTAGYIPCSYRPLWVQVLASELEMLIVGTF